MISPRVIEEADYLRRSSFTVGGTTGHKEWLHFCVRSDGFEILINFSIVDDMRSVAADGSELARLTVLSRTPNGEWDGAVELFAPDQVNVSGGAVQMRFGENFVRLANGVYTIRIALRSGTVSAELTLVPEVHPAVSNNIRMDAGTPINWALIPRLQADGWIQLGAELHSFTQGMAYHDHNWGHFEWGRDFAWEWAYALPGGADTPWTLVFVRLNNKAHTRTYMQGLFLWHHDRPVRVFRAGDIAVRHEGLLPAKQWFKIPRAMSLLEPTSAADVPKKVHVQARGARDHVSFSFEADDLAQVLIPNDNDFDGVTVINEVTGSLKMKGRVQGHPIDFAGHGMFEFIRG